MIKKSKHFSCFIFKASKTLMVKIQYKKFWKIAEIDSETVKKIQQLSYIEDRMKKVVALPRHSLMSK